MNESKAKELCAWLNGLGKHIRDARPVKVSINGTDYYGARYTAVNQYTEGMRIVQEGKVKAGDEYTDDRFYLLGKRPLKIKNRASFCFPYDGAEWYIGGGYYGGGDEQHKQYHPFGIYFSVHKWDVPDGTKIDTYERHEYVRSPMTVVDLP